MTEKKNPSHGGVRPGSGRPKSPASVRLRVRVLPEEMAAIKERGGDIWLKRVIREALELDGKNGNS